MNLLVLANRRAGVRSLRISASQVFAAVAIFAVVLGGAGFLAGAGVTWGLKLRAERQVDVLEAQVAYQTAALDALEQSLENNMEALVARVGSLSAHVTRLDALGQRLTTMADLDDGEFNFAASPPMGGPEAMGDYPAVLVTGDEVFAELTSLERQLEDRRRQLQALESMLLTRTVAQRVEPAGAPVEGGWISSAYGRRTDPIDNTRAWHAGIDFAGTEGMPIKAVADGVVTWSARRYGYGYLVEITHGNGLVTRYAHNSDNLVAVGDRVTKGQLIARMGSTGRATGPNLHFEVLRNGRTVNPISFVRAGKAR